VSDEGPLGPALQAGRKLADQARHGTVRVLTAPQRQRAELAEAQAELAEVRGLLASTRQELAVAQEQQAAAELDRDGRRLPDPVERAIQAVQQKQLTTLTRPALRDLAAAALDLERNHATGLVVEAGAGLGGSAIVLASAKSTERAMKVYDGFGLVPEPGERDDAAAHEHHKMISSVAGQSITGSYDEMAQSFARLGVTVGDHQVELVAGRFEDIVNVDEPVALAHLSVAWYDATMTCLERLTPQLVPGGRLVFDDYDRWPGARAAVDDYFRNRIMDFRFERHQRLHIVRR
jgi:hypothetical protein